jgi:CubicO group peptidase (beta-lactamase class C family)
MHARRKGLVAVVVAAAFGIAGARAEEARFQAARATIEGYVTIGAVPSIAVAVAERGRIVWEEGFGWADRARRVTATEHTPYALASITKTITAVDLMLLVDRGSVDLDRPVNAYLGDAKLVARVGRDDEATVRRVANHTAGLPLHYHFFYDDEGRAPPPMEETIRHYGRLVMQPGETYQYSNLGYGVLSHLIGRVAGQSYADFTRDALFAKLGMTRSWIGRPPPAVDPAPALRYASDGRAVPFYRFDHDGASAAFASAHDLVRFGMFCLGDALPGQARILSEPARREMFRPTTDTNLAGVRRGVGWSIRKLAGHEAFSHNGGMAGVATSLLLLPDADAVVVVLANGEDTAAVQAVVDRIVAALLPGEEQRRVFAPELGLRGAWRGAVEADHGKVPVEIEIGDRVSIRVAGAPQEVFDARIEDGLLVMANVAGDLGRDAAGPYPYRLQFRLKPRGDVLNGAVTAVSAPVAGRIGNALSYWIELKRMEARE